MVYYDSAAKNLIKNLPTDAKITVMETYSELIFPTTPYEILLANGAVNKLFSKQGYLSVLDILMAFGIEPGLINRSPDLTGILYGWKWQCYMGYDQPWITFWIGVNEKNGEIIFPLSYDVDPCSQFQDCYGDLCSFSHESLLP